jgi:hypothetical protein
MQSMKYVSSADEEAVNAFIWVLDKTIHHDAFVQQQGRLKEYKHKLQRIKIMFGGGKIFCGNGNNSLGSNTNNVANNKVNLNLNKNR